MTTVKLISLSLGYPPWIADIIIYQVFKPDTQDLCLPFPSPSLTANEAAHQLVSLPLVLTLQSISQVIYNSNSFLCDFQRKFMFKHLDLNPN